MIQGQKFKALARSIIATFVITHLSSYVFMIRQEINQEPEKTLLISAYQFLALTLIIATGTFYYLKHQATLIEEE